MKYFRKTIIILICLIALTTFTTKSSVAAVENASMLFLRIVGSPQATGMGGCVVNNVNEQSALYSPGAFGIFNLDNNFSISFPSNTKWLPELANMQFKTFSVSGGYSFLINNNKENIKQKLSAGIAYSTMNLDYGSFIWTDELGNYLGTSHSYDKTANYTLGIGFEHLVRIGFGITYKRIESKMARYGGGAELAYSTAKGSAPLYANISETKSAVL